VIKAEGADEKGLATIIGLMRQYGSIKYSMGVAHRYVSRAKALLDTYLKDCQVVHFDDFAINPNIADIERGISLFRKHPIDMVVAVGGGSVMDIAKSINVLASHEGALEAFVTGKKKITHYGKTLIAIPTTSGTGSEATHFAVAYINKQKYSLASPYMLPSVAIVDPILTYQLPPAIAASTGMDAFGQAMESYWSTQSTDESKSYAREAILLIVKNLVTTVKTSNKNAKTAMSRAAHLAGKAINISKTTASHAMSYPITSYFGIPHGHAVGLTLSRLMLYNDDVTEENLADSRGVEYVKRTMSEVYSMLDVSGKEAAAKVVNNLLEEIGLATKLSELGIYESDFTRIISEISEERAGNNPRRFTKEDGRDILHQIM